MEATFGRLTRRDPVGSCPGVPRPRSSQRGYTAYGAQAMLVSLVKTVIWIVVLAFTALCVTSQTQRRADDERLRPPDQLTCPRDQLTSYTGRVVSFSRAAGRTTLRIRTDWETTERVIVQHPGTRDPSPRFLIGGEPFTSGDWVHIEDAGGHLRRVSGRPPGSARKAVCSWIGRSNEGGQDFSPAPWRLLHLPFR